MPNRIFVQESNMYTSTRTTILRGKEYNPMCRSRGLPSPSDLSFLFSPLHESKFVKTDIINSNKLYHSSVMFARRAPMKILRWHAMLRASSGPPVEVLPRHLHRIRKNATNWPLTAEMLKIKVRQNVPPDQFETRSTLSRGNTATATCGTTRRRPPSETEAAAACAMHMKAAFSCELVGGDDPFCGCGTVPTCGCAQNIGIELRATSGARRVATAALLQCSLSFAANCNVLRFAECDSCRFRC